MTLAEAKNLAPGQIIYQKSGRRRWYVSGQTKTWRKDEGKIKIPIKSGLHGHGYLIESNLDEFTLEELTTMKPNRERVSRR